MISGENPISFEKTLQVITEIQIFPHMTIYGQTFGVFKSKNNECIRL